jgi:hypothetical protein
VCISRANASEPVGLKVPTGALVSALDDVVVDVASAL